MRTTAFLPLIALVAAGCGSMQPTTLVRDDVYDIPDRSVVAAAPAASEATGEPSGFVEDYYNPADSGLYDLGTSNERSYNDITYNDPQWYNQGRFSFGVGVSSWGSSYGMGMSYGYPGFYDPFWGNSYMSGYGAWGYPGFGGWGMSMGMYYGGFYPYGGYPPYYGGYYPYGGYCPSCYACYGGFSQPTIAHRPSLSSGGGSQPGGLVVPRQYQPNSLSRSRPTQLGGVRDVTRTVTGGQRATGTKQSGRSTNGGVQQRGSGSGGSRNGGSMQRSGGTMQRGGGSTGGGGGSRPSTGGGRR
jgi:hypothetical protein